MAAITATACVKRSGVTRVPSLSEEANETVSRAAGGRYIYVAAEQAADSKKRSDWSLHETKIVVRSLEAFKGVTHLHGRPY